MFNPPLYFNKRNEIQNFFVTGINYKKSHATIRSAYALNEFQYSAILSKSLLAGVAELFVLSTCNRTEIYGFCDDPNILASLLCSETEGSLEKFKEISFTKNGKEAVTHLFNVAAGLDSQILGDYEIVSQLKLAVKFAKEKNRVLANLERLINSVLQASKEIKNTTKFSDGTISVSFAAVQFLKATVANISQKNILLLGTGKIGRNTCRNLVDYLGTNNITLINRTEQKAIALATELGLNYASVDTLPLCIAQADIIIAATNSDEPVILKQHLIDKGPKCIIDLSIPYNVEPAAQGLENLTLVNVDELSKTKDQTLQQRMAEIPKVVAIISRHVLEFLKWQQMRRHVTVLKSVKVKLEELRKSYQQQDLLAGTTSEVEPLTAAKIQRVINGMAIKLKHQNQQGCDYLGALNEYISAARN